MKPIFPARFVRCAAPVATLVLVTACGGGGGSDGSGSSALTVPPDTSGAAAADASDETLTRNASARIIDGYAINAAAAGASLGSLGERAGPLAAFDAGTGMIAGAAGGGQSGDDPLTTALTQPGDQLTFDDGALAAPSALVAGLDGLTDDSFLRDLVEASLADGHGGTVVREGDRLTIDPDDTAFCARLVQLTEDRADCFALVPDMRLTLDAATDSSGIVEWHFRGNAFLSVAYAPMAATYEVSLYGLAELLRAADELDDGVSDLPEHISGALRLSTRIDDATSGAEAGSVALSVSRAIAIEDAQSGTRFSLAASNLFSLSADAATGDADLDVSIGALSLVLGIADDTSDGLEQITQLGLSMAGFALEATLDGTDETLTVARLGLGGQPLVASIDGQEAIRYSLPDTGFVLNAQGQVMLTAPLVASFQYTLDPMAGSTIGSRWTAPSGTVLAERGELLAILSGGPLEVVTSVPDEQGNPFTTTVTVPSGTCLGENDAGEPTAVACN